MKILLISPEDIKGKRWGGVTTYTVLLAKYLAKLDIEVFFLTPGNKNESFYRESYEVFRIKNQIGKPKGILLRIFYKILNNLNKILPAFTERLCWMVNVLRFVKKNGPFDIIEAPEWGGSTLLISLLTKNRVIVRLHRGWFCYKKDNALPINIDEWLVCFLEFMSIIFTTAITSPTKYMFSYYKFILSIFKIRKRDSLIKIIPYGVELLIKTEKQNTKKKYLLSVGRIEKAKGSFVLVKAFKHILKKIKDVKLVFIGEDTEMMVNGRLSSYKKYLKSYIYKNHLEEAIYFLPKKTREQLEKYYRDCLFFILPSEGNENAPLSLLEAISFNKTAIGSKTGGIPEIIKDRTNGLLFDSGNEAELADKIGFLLRNKSLRLKFERYNIRYKKKFDINITTLKTLSFYKKVLKE